MLTIDVRHPDVLEFINAKKDRTKVTGANISVMLRDDFMQCVKEDKDYILRWPCEDPDHSQIVDLKSLEYNKLEKVDYGEVNCNEVPGYCFVTYIKKVKAREIYDAIVENAWENAEPGQMFIDKHHDYSPDSVYTQYKGITTNP